LVNANLEIDIEGKPSQPEYLVLEEFLENTNDDKDEALLNSTAANQTTSVNNATSNSEPSNRRNLATT
jgi:hypothetical protein